MDLLAADELHLLQQRPLQQVENHDPSAGHLLGIGFHVDEQVGMIEPPHVFGQQFDVERPAGSGTNVRQNLAERQGLVALNPHVDDHFKLPSGRSGARRRSARPAARPGRARRHHGGAARGNGRIGRRQPGARWSRLNLLPRGAKRNLLSRGGGSAGQDQQHRQHGFQPACAAAEGRPRATGGRSWQWGPPISLRRLAIHGPFRFRSVSQKRIPRSCTGCPQRGHPERSEGSPPISRRFFAALKMTHRPRCASSYWGTVRSRRNTQTGSPRQGELAIIPCEAGED